MPLLNEFLRHQPSGCSFFLHHSLCSYDSTLNTPSSREKQKEEKQLRSQGNGSCLNTIPLMSVQSSCCQTCHIPFPNQTAQRAERVSCWLAALGRERSALGWGLRAIQERKVVLVSYFTAACLHPPVPTSSCSPTSLPRLPVWQGPAASSTLQGSPGTGWVPGPRCPALVLLCHW